MYGSPLSSSFFHRFPPPPVHLPRSMVSCYPSPRTTVSTRKNRQGFQRMTPVSNRLDGWMVGSSRTLSTGRSTDCDQKKLPSMFFGNDPKGINMTFFRGGEAFLGECIVGRSEVFPSSPDVPALPVHAGHHKDDCSFSKGGTLKSRKRSSNEFFERN